MTISASVYASILAKTALPGRLEKGGHVLSVRVYYEDTDAAGRVYYANYLKYAERARTEALFALGWNVGRLAEEDGFTFVVRRCETDYLAPAGLGDIVEIRTCVTEARGAGFTMTQVVSSDTQELARLVVDLACIGRSGKPVRLPILLKEALAGLH